MLQCASTDIDYTMTRQLLENKGFAKVVGFSHMARKQDEIAGQDDVLRAQNKQVRIHTFRSRPPTHAPSPLGHFAWNWGPPWQTVRCTTILGSGSQRCQSSRACSLLQAFFTRTRNMLDTQMEELRLKHEAEAEQRRQAARQLTADLAQNHQDEINRWQANKRKQADTRQALKEQLDDRQRRRDEEQQQVLLMPHGHVV